MAARLPRSRVPADVFRGLAARSHALGGPWHTGDSGRFERHQSVFDGLTRTRSTWGTQGTLFAGPTLSVPRVADAALLSEIDTRSTRAATSRVPAPRVRPFESLSISRQVVITQIEQQSRHMRRIQPCSLHLTINVSRFFGMIERPRRSREKSSSRFRSFSVQQCIARLWPLLGSSGLVRNHVAGQSVPKPNQKCSPLLCQVLSICQHIPGISSYRVEQPMIQRQRLTSWRSEIDCMGKETDLGKRALTPAVFRLVPVRLRWLYWAIIDPAVPQCPHNQYRWHIRI